MQPMQHLDAAETVTAFLRLWTNKNFMPVHALNFIAFAKEY
jgi:hypothetical protein